jgi:hypothetical protein
MFSLLKFTCRIQTKTINPCFLYEPYLFYGPASNKKFYASAGWTLQQSSAVHIPASYSADVILSGSCYKLRLLVINLASVPGRQLVNSPTVQSLER